MNSNRLYRNRTLTDNVNMVFDFVGENWRKWFKMMAYFLLPFSVFLGTTLTTLYDESSTSMSETMYVVSHIGTQCLHDVMMNRVGVFITEQSLG